MVMLRDEDNAKYREVVKNTLEFDPEILKRYVNFMNNPDERTAVDQFGTGDKYFGICTLMATMPGLPMFGHGQVEGFTERYGMEYRRAYHDERPDAELVERHQRQIAPLLYRRALFAEARDFRLYDFFTDDGRVNEDVIAYSNQHGDERALVVYHNRYASTQGWIRTSSAYAENTGAGDRLRQQSTLAQALGAADSASTAWLCRDAVSGLHHVHRSRRVAEEGLRFGLDAYTCHVFVDWREVSDDETHRWTTLAEQLDGRGVPSLDEAIRLLRLQPVHAALRALLDPALLGALGVRRGATREEAVRLRAFLEEAMALARESPDLVGGAFEGDPDDTVRAFKVRLEAMPRLAALQARFAAPWTSRVRALLIDGRGAVAGILAWAALEALGRLMDPGNASTAAARLFDTLRLREVLGGAAARLGLEGDDAWRLAARLRVALAHAGSASAIGKRSTRARARTPRAPEWLDDPDVAWLTGVNEHDGVRYFVKEPFEDLLWWMAVPTLLSLAADPSPSAAAVAALEHAIAARQREAEATGYRLG
jgi:hypothetical protein